MRTLIKIILIVALILFSGNLYARSTTVIVGQPVTAAASCNTSNDTALETVMNDTVASGQTVTSVAWRAQQVIIGAQSTITQYIFKAQDNEAEDNLLVSLYTDSSDVPGSLVAGTTVTIPHTSIGSSAEVVTATLDTPKTGLAAGTYWLVFRTDDVGSQFVLYTASSGLDATVDYAYDTAYPSSWTNATNRDAYVVIMGCTE